MLPVLVLLIPTVYKGFVGEILLAAELYQFLLDHLIGNQLLHGQLDGVIDRGFTPEVLFPFRVRNRIELVSPLKIAVGLLADIVYK